jgi:hypothetical protein
MRHLSWTIRGVIAVTVITAFATAASAATGPGSLTFTNTPLLLPDGAGAAHAARMRNRHRKVIALISPPLGEAE